MSYGITSNRLVLSVVEVSKEESEGKKTFLNNGQNFPILMKIINPQSHVSQKNSKQKEHEENYIKAHYNPIAQNQPDKNDTLCTRQQFSYRKKCRQGGSGATFLRYQKGKKTLSS